MFIIGTRSGVADNTGAKRIGTFKLYGGSRRRFARTGNLIKVSVKDAAPNGKIKAGEKSHAVICRTRKKTRRPDGSYIRFDRNAVVLLNKGELVGSRVFGPMPRELRTSFNKIASLAAEVL